MDKETSKQRKLEVCKVFEGSEIPIFIHKKGEGVIEVLDYDVGKDCIPTTVGALFKKMKDTCSACVGDLEKIEKMNGDALSNDPHEIVKAIAMQFNRLIAA